MPSFDIVKKLDVKETYRVARVLSDFDMDKSKGDVHFKGEIEIPEISALHQSRCFSNV